MLALRTRIFIVVSLVILVILGLSLILVIVGKKDKEKEKTNTPSISQTGDVVLPSGQVVVTNPVERGLVVKQPSTLEMEQNNVKQLARIFLERINSYSSESNYQNIAEVEGLVTDSLWAKIKKPVGSGNSATGNFVGVTTKVFSTELTNWQTGTAEVLLRGQLEEEKNGTSTNKIISAKVELIKNGENWLVNSYSIQ